MNTSKLILVTASIPFLAAPALSLADKSTAMNACVDAFVSANLSKEQKVTVKKLDVADSPVEIHGRAYWISLTARGVDSGKRLAEATCLVERDGTVIALNDKPVSPALTDAKATLTSR